MPLGWNGHSNGVAGVVPISTIRSDGCPGDPRAQARGLCEVIVAEMIIQKAAMFGVGCFRDTVYTAVIRVT